MKVRSGFVSNSSTTSFLIGVVRKAKPCPTCGRSSGDILKLCEDHNHWESEMGSVGENIIEKLKDDCYGQWETDEDSYRESIELVKDWMSKCETVFTYELSYHDDHMRYILESAEEAGDIMMEEF